MIEIDAIAKAEHPALVSARNLHLILELAQLRGLPMPFVAKAYEFPTRPVTLQVRDANEVAAWAEAMEVEVVMTTVGGFTTYEARGEMLEVAIEVASSVVADEVAA